MFKNKEGLVRSGWKIMIMVTVVMALAHGSGYGFDWLMNYITMKTTDGNNLMANQKLAELYNRWWMALFYIQEIILIAVPLLIWKVFLKQSSRNLGLDSIRKHGKEFFTGLGIGAVSIALVFVFLLMTGNAEVASWEPDFSADAVIYLFMFVWVGFAEELMCRGYIISVMRQTRNIPLMVMVSALIFSIIHIFNNSFSFLPFFNIMMIGIVFAFMYIWSGNLWMCIGYHISWNYFQGNVFGFPVSGNDTGGSIIKTFFTEDNLINGGGFGPEGGFAVTAVIVLGFFYTKWYYRGTSYRFLDADSGMMRNMGDIR